MLLVDVPIADRDDDGANCEDYRHEKRKQHDHLACFAQSLTIVAYSGADFFERPTTLITRDLPQRDQPLSFPALIIPLLVGFATLGANEQRRRDPRLPSETGCCSHHASARSFAV